jgi:hypothetical protein
MDINFEKSDFKTYEKAFRSPRNYISNLLRADGYYRIAFDTTFVSKETVDAIKANIRTVAWRKKKEVSIIQEKDNEDIILHMKVSSKLKSVRGILSILESNKIEYAYEVVDIAGFSFLEVVISNEVITYEKLKKLFKSTRYSRHSRTCVGNPEDHLNLIVFDLGHYE